MSTIKSSAENLTLNADGSGNDVIIQSNASTKAIVTAEGNVGIGNTTPEAWDSAFSVLQLGGAAAIWGHSGTAGYLSQNMYNDGAYKYLSTSGASLILMNGGEFKFRTAASGSADATITWTEALDLGTEGDVTVPTGDIVFGTAGKGIVLGATTNTDANTLDDYEEGTWTPDLTNGTSESTNTATYIKIGNKVFYYVYIDTLIYPSNTDHFIIGGLPFTCRSAFYQGGTIGYVGDSDLASQGLTVVTTSTYIYFHRQDGTTNRAFNNTMDSCANLTVSGSYEVTP